MDALLDALLQLTESTIPSAMYTALRRRCGRGVGPDLHLRWDVKAPTIPFLWRRGVLILVRAAGLWPSSK